MNEKMLIYKTIDAWVSLGISPATVFEHIADAFSNPSFLIDNGYETHERKKIEGSIRSVAEEIKSLGWN
jgi:hypothetical protein